MRVFLIGVLSLAASLQVSTQSPPTVGPARGTVVLASAQTPLILTSFIELAGGADALIVLVPTAALNKPGGPQIGFARTSPPETALKSQGAKNVTVLHTFDRAALPTLIPSSNRSRAPLVSGSLVDCNPSPLSCSGEYFAGRKGRRIAAWSFGLI